MKKQQARQFGYGWLCITGWLMGMAGQPVAAAMVDDLYHVQVPVSNRGERARNDAFGVALGVVAVRVSGRSDGAAKLGASISHARRYVQRFGYSAGGLLDVGFEATGVQQLLEKAGLPIWGRERPNVVVLLPPEYVNSDTARKALAQAADRRGIPLVWGGVDSQLPASVLTARYPVDAVLQGRLIPSAGSAPQLSWSLLLDGVVNEVQGDWANAINFAADHCARLFAVMPHEVSEVSLDVTNIRGVDAYAATLNYLSGLSMVSAVNVSSVAHDAVRFQLTLRGGQAVLLRTLALEQRLLVEEMGQASGQLSFRYPP